MASLQELHFVIEVMTVKESLLDVCMYLTYKSLSYKVNTTQAAMTSGQYCDK